MLSVKYTTVLYTIAPENIPCSMQLTNFVVLIFVGNSGEQTKEYISANNPKFV